MAQILVIDDEVQNRIAIEQVLISHGHEVRLAADGTEGLQRLRSAPADLVITDLVMPSQDGIETIRQLRQDFPAVRIIAMSGDNAAGARLAVAKYLGAGTVLEKPFTSDQLLEAIGKLL